MLLVLCAAVLLQASTRPDLGFMAGEWTGTLTYIDYQDDRTRREIKASMAATATADGLRYRFSYVEPDGRVVEGEAVTITLGADGSQAPLVRNTYALRRAR